MATVAGDGEYSGPMGDTGPLSWLMNEIRDALNRSAVALEEAVQTGSLNDVANSTSFKLAKTYLHQAHGALQMVDIAGVLVITEAAQSLFDKVDAGKHLLTVKDVHTLRVSYQALCEHLEELLAGRPNRSGRLFPYYEDLMLAQGVERVNHAELFFPTLTPVNPVALPPLHTEPLENAALAARYAQLRQRFETGLLPYMKASNVEAERNAVAELTPVVAEVYALQQEPEGQAFWWSLLILTGAVEEGVIVSDRLLKQLFGRINIQLRQLSQGGVNRSSLLQRDALFFMATAPHASPAIQAVRDAFGLQGIDLGKFDIRHYGKVDIDVLRTARELTNQVKSSWERLSSSDNPRYESFAEEVSELAATGAILQPGKLELLTAQLARVVSQFPDVKPTPEVGLEVARVLLFIDSSLQNIYHLPDGYDEQIEVNCSRLAAIAEGQRPASHQEEDIYRASRDQQVLRSLVQELVVSLRQVEKQLDDYFLDPTVQSGLPAIDKTLHQIEGALAIQGQDAAIEVVQLVRTHLRQFGELPKETLPQQSDFERVARNIGALSFYIETLTQHDSGASAFTFDAATGIYQVNMLQHRVSDAVAPQIALDHAPSYEADLLPKVTALDEAVAELTSELGSSPDMTEAQSSGATPEISLTHSLKPIPELSAESSGARAVAPSDPVTVEEVDGELLEIFLGEAKEVLADLFETLPKAIDAPHDQQILAVMRRGFHTLKGSSRMVGLNQFGEASWQVERVLNSWVADGRAGTHDLFQLLTDAAYYLREWVRELQTGSTGRSPRLITMASSDVADGRSVDPAVSAEMHASIPMRSNDSIQTEAGLAPAAQAPTEGLDHRETPLSESIDPPMLELFELFESFDSTHIQSLPSPALPSISGLSDSLAATDAHTTVPASEDEAMGATASEEALPTLDQVFDEQPVIESVDSPLPVMLDGFSVEAIPDMLDAQAETAAESPLPEVPFVEEPTVQDKAEPIAGFIALQDESDAASTEASVRADENSIRIGPLSISQPLYNIYMSETESLVELLVQDFEAWRMEPKREVADASINAAHSLSGSSATVGFKSLQELAHSLELVLQCKVEHPAAMRDADHEKLLRVANRIRWMLQRFAQGEIPDFEPLLVQSMNDLRRALEGRKSSSAGDLRSLGPNSVQALVVETPVSGVEAVPFLAPPAPVSLASLAAAEASLNDRSGFDPLLALKDDLDPDLLPVFIEEGSDMLPAIGTALRSWQQRRSDITLSQGILRHLHTVKGSARMAGAMRLGQHMHEMESHIELILRNGTPTPEILEELVAHYDVGLQMFDDLQQPPSATAVAPSEASAESPDGQAPNVTEIAHEVAGEQVRSVSQIRVSGDILDRLTNQAGEVSIVRSRLDAGIETMRQSLFELAENIDRLRGQLRELDIQAESQISARMTNSGDREFDPLEFDRFTRLQELTRIIAESINDVATVQKNLVGTVGAADIDLVAQSRLTRELQQELMRVRMVQFGSIAERLYRLTRQVSKELNKRVALEIIGSSVEIDRGVLEKMTGPLEHVLRNAIVHGIETVDVRRNAGKRDIGELKIEIRQEGNEIIMRLSDDGRGLNFDLIAKKARSLGLIPSDAQLADHDIGDLIFLPGFSTAASVTELAGRGVGMDVVRSEANSLGGRVSAASQSGKGTLFTIQLPLTLAVIQVVLIRAGERTYSVPSAMVQQVLQLKRSDIDEAYQKGSIIWQGSPVPLNHLSFVLGMEQPVTKKSSGHIFILKSDSDYVAIEVDDAMGNREVVVKNIGPQLSRMIGISGATVLGTGEIVLILNPVPLVLRMQNEPRLRDKMLGAGSAEMQTQAESATPVRRRQLQVMVVDDSLTVRRVTQRLLLREGYQVILAKDGLDALQQLQVERPDIMLIDIEMPRMDGFDLMRNVRGSDRTHAIPIIVITSRMAEKHRSYALELGANDYLGKPYQEEELLKAIDSLMSAAPAA